jgi:hypothetical protein
MSEMRFEVPDKWKPILQRYMQDHYGEERDYLRPADLTAAVGLHFPDGFVASYVDALYLVNPSDNELLVFTERSGPQVFRLHGLEITTQPSQQVRSFWRVADR